ncbi:U3 small nucleolar ribonucleoprotein IMP4 [Methanomicrobium sp. W14]|uniref:hypothetical protein n=1 Tax=Methanomicrobium sp. W14 TaxID=2817839 RepID=UPI001AE9E384|nr:hypothetical protein [Methanomicrobium sp. W14]MBP2132462.1 U3 small nucleolar ribonucleoprotein IMP4 [Methanomicrobium sp. W14]
MMEVTTSRKPAPPLRTFSKDLAFSFGGHYFPRGKAGIEEITGVHEDVLIVSREGRDYSVEIYRNSCPVYRFLFSSYSVKKRDDNILRGLVTGSQDVFEDLKDYLNISKADCESCLMKFDGAQGRRYVLRLKKEG